MNPLEKVQKSPAVNPSEILASQLLENPAVYIRHQNLDKIHETHLYYKSPTENKRHFHHPNCSCRARHCD